MHNTEMQKTVIRMRAEGKSIRSIADELEISPTTVCQWNKEFTADIREAHKQELEDVLDGLHANKVQRTRALVKAFKKIELYIQNKDFTPADLRIYSLMMRLDRYIAQDIMHDVPPLPPKHICPDPIINVTTDMPIPAPRSKAATVDPDAQPIAATDPARNSTESIESSREESINASNDNTQTDFPNTAAEAIADPAVDHAGVETTTFVAKGNHYRSAQSRQTPSGNSTAPAGSGTAVVTNKVLLPSITKGRSEGSPNRDTINIHVDRNRNVTPFRRTDAIGNKYPGQRKPSIWIS